MSIIENHNDNAVNDATSPAFKESYEEHEPEIRAVSPNELMQINIDVPAAVTTVLGVEPEVRQLRPALATLPSYDVTCVDKLSGYALALGHAHAMYRAAAGPIDQVTDLAAETTELRDTLHSDAMALARRKLLDEGRVMKLKTGSGYKNIAFDVLGLVGVMRESWSTIEGKTAVRAVELDKAEQSAKRLLTALGFREQGPAAVGVTAEMRQRAFTLFMRAYDEARRGVVFLRWHEGDADAIAPSLYAGRSNGRRTASSETPATADVSSTDTAASALPGGSTPSGAVVTGPATPAAPIGMPGSNPFGNP